MPYCRTIEQFSLRLPEHDPQDPKLFARSGSTTLGTSAGSTIVAPSRASAATASVMSAARACAAPRPAAAAGAVAVVVDGGIVAAVVAAGPLPPRGTPIRSPLRSGFRNFV